MYKKFLLFLFLPLILVACGSDEPEDGGLFQLQINSVEGDVDLALGLHSAELGITGQSNTIVVDLVGDFDSFNLSAGIPEWITVTTSGHTITINVSYLEDENTRTGKVGFTVFKGSKSETGTVTISQRPMTEADWKNIERKTMNEYLAQYTVIDKLPSIKDIKTGADAPYYKLDAEGKVYMQVVSMGTDAPASNGETIYLRFEVAIVPSLLPGSKPNWTGNWDIVGTPYSFVYGTEDNATKQLGKCIQMPLLIGLPVTSQVNLVASSEYCLQNAQEFFVPCAYRLRYYREKY